MKQRVAVTDKNGKPTHVWKNGDSQPTKARELIPPVLLSQQQPKGFELPVWKPSVKGIDTPDGAFDKCKRTSAEYTKYLKQEGYEADQVKVAEATRYYSNAAKGWKGFSGSDYVHYLTRVIDDEGSVYYIDYTARQFDPEAAYPEITPAEEYEKKWLTISKLDENGDISKYIKFS